MLESTAGGSRDSRGVALLIVITVLVVLVMIAVPFVLTMRHGQENTEALAARERADLEAGLLLQMMKQYLQRTHPSAEIARQGAASVRAPGAPAPAKGALSTDTDPEVDVPEEFDPGTEEFRRLLDEVWKRGWTADPQLASRVKALEQQRAGPSRDDRGSIWTGTAVDAQACVNVNGASPYLLGNLMGSAMLSEDVDAGSTEVQVENVVASRIPGFEGFPRKNGAIRVGREVITYQTFDGRAFKGCGRGAFPNAPLGLNGGAAEHKSGTAVISYDAFQLAVHPIVDQPGYIVPLANLAAARRVVEWGPAIGADRLKAVEPYLTAWGRRETAEWLASQLVINALGQGGEGAAADEVLVRDNVGNPSGTTAYYNAGTLVRISDGVRTAYNVVEQVGDDGGGRIDQLLRLAGSVGWGAPDKGGGITFEGGRARIEAWAPTPININTAPKEVLYAVLANLRMRRAEVGNDSVVHPALAWTLAERLAEERQGALRVDDEGRRTGGPFRRTEDFGRWLESLEKGSVITRLHRQAIYRNAVNPHDYELAFGTTAWCFRTLDVYHVEARVAVHDRMGQQLATATQREVVEVGADRPASWTLDSQDQFEQRLSMGSGAKWFASYPRGVMMVGRGPAANTQPPPRAPKALNNGVYPSADVAEGSGGPDMGDVRLAPARIQLPGEVRYRRHFDNTHWTDGHYTEGKNPIVVPSAGNLVENGGEARPRPFSLSFWWRSMSDATWSAFECGTSRFMNRYAVFVADGDQGRELVFRVAAGTLEQKAVECYVPLSRIAYAPGEWFHIHVSASAEDPSSAHLLVDGVDVGSLRYIAYLTASVGADARELPVDRTSGFHLRGALVIGNEIVEYDATQPEAFTECVRGARGTTAGTYSEGTPVRMLGYGMPLLQDVTAGASYLRQALLRMTAVRIDNTEDSETVMVDFGGPADVPVPIWGLAQDRRSFTATLMAGGNGVQPLWGETVTESVEAFGTTGYALLGCPRPGNLATQDGGGGGTGGSYGIPVGGWEVVRYTRSGSNFNIERYQTTSHQTAATPYFLCTHYWQKDPQYADHTVWPSFLIPISVQASGGGAPGEDYLDPGSPEQLAKLQAYGGDGDGRVLLSGNDDWNEVIRYSWRTDGSAASTLLFVQDQDLNSITTAFFGQRSFDNVPGSAPPPDPGTGGGGSGGGGSGGGGSDGGGSGGGSGSGSGEGEGDAEATGNEENGEDTTEDGGSDAADTPEADPGERPPSDEEPQPDSSGGGGTNDSDGGGLLPEVPRPDPDAADPLPPAPQADGSGLYFEPAFATLRDWSRQYFRGTNNTRDLRHDAAGGSDKASIFIPCFRVWEGYAGLVRRCGRNDILTITDGKKEAPARYEALVRWGDPGSQWVALDEPITGPVVPALEEGATEIRLDHRGRPRVLKFPCGELPEELGKDMEFGRSSISDSGVVSAFIDELFVWRHVQQPLALVRDPAGVGVEAERIILAPQGATTTLHGTVGVDPDVGIFAIGGELIVYRGTSEGDSAGGITLERCIRGALGTKARAHPAGSTGHFVFDVPVSTLAGSLNVDANTLPLTHVRSFPREGLVRILQGDTAELIHYTALNATDLLLPKALDADESVRDRGLFRGRFGTQPMGHDSNAVVLWQPFRRWDRYTGRRTEDEQDFGGFHDHPDASYLELGKRLRGCLWQRISWVEAFDGTQRTSEGTGRGGRRSDVESDTFMDVLVAMRFHPGVPWDTTKVVDLRSGEAETRGGPPVDPMQSLLVFANMDGPNRLDVESETADMRVYFRFRPNAWLPQDTSGSSSSGDLTFANAWKRSPRLQEITLEYLNRTTSRGGRVLLAR